MMGPMRNVEKKDLAGFNFATTKHISMLTIKWTTIWTTVYAIRLFQTHVILLDNRIYKKNINLWNKLHIVKWTTHWTI